MSTKKAGGSVSPSYTGMLSKGKTVPDTSSYLTDQLSSGVAEVNLDSTQDGGWEVYAKKSKNKVGSSSEKPWPTQNSNAKAWNHPDVAQRLGMRNNVPSNTRSTLPVNSKGPAGRGTVRSHPQSLNKGVERNYSTPSPTIPPPLEYGWKWNARPGSSQSFEDGKGRAKNAQNPYEVDGRNVESYDNDTDSEAADDTEDELLSDEFDSYDSDKSHETRKTNKWFKAFFQSLDNLTIDQISEPERQWHCPACQGGPGAIDWYRGLQPLMTHAKTKGSKRVQLHRILAELLDEELRRKGTSVVPTGESFGQWRGLNDEVKDKEIVWPPMVIIMNTRLEMGDDEKWRGMGNQELLEYFSSYATAKAKHSYGPQGHRGISMLIFEASALGYLEAERLSVDFEVQGKDRDAWERIRVSFCPGGKRQLYGFMAEKRDLDTFNQHSQGKQKLKFELRSYQEMVVSQLRQMSEDNQQLLWYKNKVTKEQMRSRTLEESFGILSAKLRKTEEENRIVRLRTKMIHEQNKEEMDYQEQFFKDQIKMIHEARNAKENNFEKLQQEERKKVEHNDTNLSSLDDHRQRAEEVAKFIDLQEQEMQVFVEEREKLIRVQEEKMTAMKKQHWEEIIALEKEYDAELSRLMEKFSPDGHLTGTAD